MEIDIKNPNNYGRIGVFMGGVSSEREISLRSGEAVSDSLNSSGVQVVPIDIQTEDIEENIRLIKSKEIDCAFIALHGRFGEDGSIQGILELLKIPYTGSGVLASKLAMDKVASRQIFATNGLEIPRYKTADRSSYDFSIVEDFNYPLVVKPATAGSSIGLSIIERKEELAKAVDLAFNFDQRIVFEEYISGREVTAGVLDEKALPIIEIIPKNIFFDYQAKYQPGMTDYVVPAELEDSVTEKIQVAALTAHKLLGCFGCSRTDIILNKENLPVVLEVNTIPGFTQTSLLPKAAKTIGIDFVDLCLKLIKLAYEKR